MYCNGFSNGIAPRWKLWRADYRLVNFIHDEILVELPVHTNLALHAEIVR